MRVSNMIFKVQKILPVRKHLPHYSDTLHFRNIYLQQGKVSQSRSIKKKKIPQASCLARVDQNLSAGNWSFQ